MGRRATVSRSAVATATALVGCVLFSGVPGASASSSGAYLSPRSTTIDASRVPNQTEASLGLTATGSSKNFAIFCTSFTFSFKTPKDGTTVTFSLPQFAGCSNNYGVSAMLTASGVWRANWKSTASANLINGKNELTLSGGTVPGCVITVTPNDKTRAETRLDYVNGETDLEFLTSGWPVASSPAGCWSGLYASFDAEVALTPPVKYNS
jgi:hypothetical protein